MVVCLSLNCFFVCGAALCRITFDQPPVSACLRPNAHTHRPHMPTPIQARMTGASTHQNMCARTAWTCLMLQNYKVVLTRAFKILKFMNQGTAVCWRVKYCLFQTKMARRLAHVRTIFLRGSGTGWLKNITATA